MALFILQRLAAYLRPLTFLAIGLYGMHSQSDISTTSHIYNRRISRLAGDRDLPVSADRYPRPEQIARSYLWQAVAESRYGSDST